MIQIYDKELLHSDFTIYRKDRLSREGGVMIAIKNIIPSNMLASPKDIEVFTISISIRKTLTLCVVYSPPNSSSNYQQTLLNTYRI